MRRLSGIIAHRIIKIILSTAILVLSTCMLLEVEPEIKIHYLGHSAFIFEFDNGVKLVTDYGHYNAWIDWGWDSPIHDIGELVPDIMTFSHTHHDDHYDPDRLPDGVRFILKNTDTLFIDGLEIAPIRTCEKSIDNEDNTSFLISYQGLKVLHLGDAQAQIEHIGNETVKSYINRIIPKSVDLLLMTIQGTNQFIPQTETFIDLIRPRRVIPMHFWSEEYREKFLQHLETQNQDENKYEIFRLNSSEYTLRIQKEMEPIQVISLKRAPYTL